MSSHSSRVAKLEEEERHISVMMMGGVDAVGSHWTADEVVKSGLLLLGGEGLREEEEDGDSLLLLRR